MTDTFDLLVSMTGKEWTAITTKVMWLHRVGVVDQWPTILHNIPDTVSDVEKWRAYRNKVGKARRAQAQRIRRERSALKTQNRKEYMRNYMNRYRSPVVD